MEKVIDHYLLVSKHFVKSEVGDEPLLPTHLNLPVFFVQVGSNTVLPD